MLSGDDKSTAAEAGAGAPVYCACHAKGSRGPSGSHARRGRPGGFVYCACHARGSRGPAAATRAAAPPGSCVYCTCHAKGSRGLPGPSVYCACHAKGSRGPSGGHSRRSSSRRLCVLRLPRKRQPRPQRRPRAPQLVQEALCIHCACHAKGSRGPAAAMRAIAPREGSVYCAECTAPATQKAAAGQRRPRAPQLLEEDLCTAPVTQKAAAGQRRPRAPQFLEEALCIAPATQKAAVSE